MQARVTATPEALEAIERLRAVLDGLHFVTASARAAR
jgi:hypothetical protein